tara:strand:- start:200 stop:595 length:396 start_codon:yes stop_codon:yes gene_type:complete
MIKNTCSNCGSVLGFFKTIFASKSFPSKCKDCEKKQFRRHDVSKTLGYLGGSIGLFGLLFLYMGKGLQVAGASLAGYLSLFFIVYIAELFLFDFSEYTDEEENRVLKKSKKNIYIAVVVIFLGTVFYVFDM